MPGRYIDMGDRIELAKAAMEFADKHQMKPLQLYNQMLNAVREEPGEDKDGGK